MLWEKHYEETPREAMNLDRSSWEVNTFHLHEGIDLDTPTEGGDVQQAGEHHSSRQEARRVKMR